MCARLLMSQTPGCTVNRAPSARWVAAAGVAVGGAVGVVAVGRAAAEVAAGGAVEAVGATVWVASFTGVA